MQNMGHILKQREREREKKFETVEERERKCF
jgi:hypothetical protein